MERAAAGQPLPALDAGVDENRIELDQSGPAAGPFRRNQRRPGAAKGIEDHAAAVGTVADRVAIIATGFTVGCRASLLFAVPFKAFWLT